MRRVKHFAAVPWSARYRMDWYPALAESCRALVVNNPDFIPAVKARLGVSELPKGIRYEPDWCPIARARRLGFEPEWGVHPIEYCCFAVCFDMGLLCEYELSTDEVARLYDEYEVNR